MAYIIKRLTDGDTTIDLGRRGENRATVIDFPLGFFIDNYGEGTPSLVHLRPGDTEPYVCYTVSTGDGYLRWYITDTDTAKAGSGKCELRWNVDDTGDGDTEDAYDTRAKSIIYNTVIHPSLTDETVIPDPYKDWYDAMMEGLTPVLEVESNPVFNLLDRGSEPRKSVIYAGDKLNQDKYVVPGAWWSPGWDTGHPIEDLPAVPAGSRFRFTVTGLYESTYTSDPPNYLIRKVEAEVVYGGASTSRELNVWAQIVDTRHQTSADRMTFHEWYRIPTGGDLNILTAAVTANTAKINIVTGYNTVKTLTASDDLVTLDDGHYRLNSAVPLNAPSGLASNSKYGYVTIQHRGAAGYTYYEYVAGNGNGTTLERHFGWKATTAGTTITWKA